MENNEKGYIRVTIDWLKEHYDKANRELFDGKLGDCSFALKQTSKGWKTNATFSINGGINKLRVNRYTRRMSVVNPFSYDQQGTPITRDNFVELCHPTITFVSNKSGSEKAFYTTLVHEMCHYYTYMFGICPRQGHGPEFQRIANYVSSKTYEIFPVGTYASSGEMENSELDDANKQAKAARAEGKKMRIQYIVVLMPNGSGRLVGTTSQSLIDEIVSIENRKNNRVIKVTNQDIVEEIFNKGYSSASRKYRFWPLDSTNELFQKIKQNADNYDFLNENLMKKRNEYIDITSDMNLSAESPLENIAESQGKKITLTESQLRQIIKESINELSNQTIHNAVERGQMIGRDEQTDNMIKMVIDKINKQYSFDVFKKNGEFMANFKVDYCQNYKFFIYATYEDCGRFALKPSNNSFRFIKDNLPIKETPLGYVVENLKAGPRMKLQKMAQEVKELNGEKEREV